MLKKISETIKKIPPGKRLFLYTVPWLLMYAWYCYVPMYGLAYAFLEFKPARKIWELKSVGWDNFTFFINNVINRRETIRVLRNTLIQNGMKISTCFIPMVCAIFLSEITSKRLKKIIQSLTTIPHFVSWVIIYGVCFNMFAASSGIINVVLADFGIEPINLLTAPGGKALWFKWFLEYWKGTGWGMIVYLGALSGIDQELYEAAAMDGAGRFSKMWYITIPGLMPTFVTLLIMSFGSIIGSNFDYIYIFGNAFNREWLDSLDMYTFNLGLGSGEFGLSTAMGIMQSIVGLIMLFVVNKLSAKFRGSSLF